MRKVAADMLTLSFKKVKRLLGAVAVLGVALSPPLSAGPPPLCSTVQGTSCMYWSPGATMSCTDVCFDRLTCTCVDYSYDPYYPSDPSDWFWNCQTEC